MANRNKILSDLSKFAVDAMGAFSGLREEIETIVSLRVDKIIKKMNLVKKDEFEVLKKLVQKLVIDNEKLSKSSIKQANSKRKSIKKTKVKKKPKKKR